MANSFLTKNNDLEKFILIWLDASVNDFENRTTQDDLCQLTDNFQTFNNPNECELYIETHSNNERIVLITSGRFARQIISRIHEINSIFSIYIYCYDKTAYQQYAAEYPKIRDILITKAELIERICQDNKKQVHVINKELLGLNISTDGQFLQSQLLIHHLLKIETISANHHEEFFQLYQAASTENNNNIDDFRRNYLTKNSLQWLIEDSFFSKFFAQALQTKTIDVLCISRYFLQDIYEQLKTHQCSTSIHVYHTHIIQYEEIEQLRNSIGNFITLNTFLFTTLQQSHALEALDATQIQYKILFEIDADPSVQSLVPFADITSINHSKEQSDVLFMIGSIFRIEDVYQQNDICICRMTLCGECDPELKYLFDRIEKEDQNGSILSLGNLLIELGQSDDAEKYYQHILNERTADHQNTYICNHNLGKITFSKQDYDRSLAYHLRSQEFLSNSDLNMADSCNCLGTIYFHKHEFQQSIDAYKKALTIFKLALDENYSKVITCLNNIGLIYRMEKDYSQALSYYEEVLTLQKRYLSEDHVELGSTYHNIGALNWCQGMYDEAMKYYNLSLENKMKYFSSKHSSVAMTLENIGLIYENKGQFEQAFDYYKQAADSYEESLSSTHSDVIQIHENIQRITIHLNSKTSL